MTNSRASRFRVDILFDETASRGGSCQGTPTADADSLRRRLMFCAAGLLSVFVILSMRTTQLALSSPPPRFALSDEALEDSAPVLEDSAGRALALTTRRNGLAVNGAEVWDAEETAKALGAIFPGVDTVTLEARLASRRRVLLKRVITEAEKDDALSLGLPGLSFPETEVRAYPQGRLFSHVVGYQIPGSGGVTGLEAMATREGLTGPVKTTLNVTAQTIILAELAKAQRTYGAAAAWAVLMHADTGAVAAMASLPDFDPNRPGASSPDARRNRVVSDNYELGSAFKPLTIAMALEDGLARLDTPIDVAPPLRVGDWAIRDYSDKGPVLTTEDVLAYSSNIGTAQLALLLGQERFLTALDSFGLTEPLVTALPESRRPALPQSWGDAELATISYGHGIALSPLHLVTSFAAVVNGGIRIKPRFLVAEPEEQDQILSADTSALMRRALRRVVTDGTGKRAEAAGYHVIGKTATADKPGVGGYGANDQVIASFVGAFPGHAPEWVLLVSLDEPQGIPATSGLTTAGMNAAPLFRRIVERLAPVLHVMPVADDVAIDSFMAMRNEMGSAGQVLPAAASITEAYSQPQPRSLSPYHDPITPLLRGSAGGGDAAGEMR